MSAKLPSYHDLFKVVAKGTKNPDLCCVKFCRKGRVKGRRVCHNHHIVAWRMRHPLKSAFATLRDHAKRRKLTFTLTIKQYEELIGPSGYLTHKGNTKHDLHLDRIDPTRGYEFDNLQVLTCSENSAKGATKDKAQYVAERLARLASSSKQSDDPGNLKYSQPENDDPF